MILLFTEAAEQFELNTSLNKEFSIYIENCELMRVAEVLGMEFYKDVDRHPENYAELLPYIKKCSMYWAYDMYLRQSSSKNSVLGSVVLNADNTTHDKIEKQYKIKSNLEVCHFYEKKLWEYLQENANKYPLYNRNFNKTKMPNFSVIIGERKDVGY